MEQLTREEIARVDLIHRRADEALAQIAAGHIITECQVLYENEGCDVVWKERDLQAWAAYRPRLIEKLREHDDAINHVLGYGGRILHGRNVAHIDEMFQPNVTRGFIMYRESAAYLAAHPPADPYARRREVEQLIEREMISEGFSKPTKPEPAKAFPAPARNPR